MVFQKSHPPINNGGSHHEQISQILTLLGEIYLKLLKMMSKK